MEVQAELEVPHLEIQACLCIQPHLEIQFILPCYMIQIQYMLTRYLPQTKN